MGGTKPRRAYHKQGGVLQPTTFKGHCRKRKGKLKMTVEKDAVVRQKQGGRTLGLWGQRTVPHRKKGLRLAPESKKVLKKKGGV